MEGNLPDGYPPFGDGNNKPFLSAKKMLIFVLMKMVVFVLSLEEYPVISIQHTYSFRIITIVMGAVCSDEFYLTTVAEDDGECNYKKSNSMATSRGHGFGIELMSAARREIKDWKLRGSRCCATSEERVLQNGVQ